MLSGCGPVFVSGSDSRVDLTVITHVISIKDDTSNTKSLPNSSCEGPTFLLAEGSRFEGWTRPVKEKAASTQQSPHFRCPRAGSQKQHHRELGIFQRVYRGLLRFPFWDHLEQDEQSMPFLELWSSFQRCFVLCLNLRKP